MKELVLDLVTSYENRMSMVEELVSRAYYATATLDESLAEVAEKRAGLKTTLQEILARNCSLRRKDFNLLMERITSESETKKRGLEEERKRVKQELEGYLDEQKQLVASLRQQLVDFSVEEGGKEGLEATIASIRTAYQDKGQQVFALLRDFQLRLDSFRIEQEEINHKLQRLVERGESLRLEDLRQLEAAKAGQERRAERELRRQEVERLLAHFKVQRQGNSRRRW
jgi:regulator of replication initiation timing